MKNRTLSKHDPWLIAALFLFMSAVALGQPATTQPATSQPGVPAATTSNASTTTPPAKDSAAKPAPSRQSISSGQAIYLVRSTLMMLNDANRSGNYTVLRDLAAPEFQSRNSAADLAQSFLDLRRRKFDLFAVSFASPQFSSDPSVDSSGKVRLMGFFPTQPLQINFDLTFESV